MSQPTCNVTVNGVGYYDPNSGTGISASSSSSVVFILVLTMWLTFQGNYSNPDFIISAIMMVICLGWTAQNAFAASKNESTTKCTGRNYAELKFSKDLFLSIEK